MAHDLLCLQDIIGYKTPCEVTPSRSGYFVNDLPGISFKAAENTANEEYKNGKLFIENLIKVAKLQVIDEMEMHLRPYFRQNSILQARGFCNFIDGYGTPGTGEAGVIVKKYDNSRYTRIYIPKITVMVSASVSLIIKINDGGLITTFAAVDLTADTPMDILIDYTANMDSIKIYFDQTGVSVRNTSCAIGCGSCGNAGLNNTLQDQITIYGFDSTSDTLTTFNGIIPSVAIECVPANLVCDYSKYVGLATLYKFGGLFWGEASVSKRSNPYILYQKEDAGVKATYYDNFDESAPGMYQKQMKSIINSVLPYLNSVKDGCITCNGNQYGWVTG